MKITQTISFPCNLGFVDTETRGEIDSVNRERVRHKFWFGYVSFLRTEKGIPSRKRLHYLESIQDFWELIEKRLDKTRPLYIFAHNLGFDLTILDFWGMTETYGWKVEFCVLEDPPTIIKMQINDCTCFFIDTLNFWRCSLKELGKSIGLEKGEMPSRGKSQDEWDMYCQRDVEILEQAILKLFHFLRSNNLGSFGLTAPSIAMNCFKHRFLKLNQIFIHDNDRVLRMERSSYYGGLVQNFFIGTIKKSIFQFDVNSLYPSVMRNSFPCKYLGIEFSPSLTKFRSIMKNYGVCADVDISSKTEAFPKRMNSRLCDVNGNFNTILCGPELERAEKYNCILKINCLSYYGMEKIFADFVEYFYKKRLEFKCAENTIDEQFCKLLMNSLYGKFGQSGYDWVDLNEYNLKNLYQIKGLDLPKQYKGCNFSDMMDWTSQEWFPLGLPDPIKIRSFGGKIQIKIIKGEHYESCPIIAAYVTAYAREFMRATIKIVGLDQCYYCDTDSLFVSAAGRKKLYSNGFVHDSDIGMFKFCGKSELSTFKGAKSYTFAGHEKLKGVRSDALQIGENEYMQNQFEGLRSVLKRGAEPYIEIKWIQKLMTNKYEKGILQKNGRVIPFTLAEF